MLVLKNNIIFIHIPKTAGRFVHNTVKKLGILEDKYYCHSSLSKLKPEHLSYYKVSIIRNPWEWYVSLWAFNKKMCRTEYTFEEFLKGIYTKEIRVPLLRKIKDKGFLTGLVKHQCYLNGVDCIDEWIKFEELSNLTHALKIKGIDFKHKVGKTEHKPFKEYYNQELIDLVSVKEAHIIQKFNYSY